MNLRAALIFLVLGFIGLLIVMGAASFVRWLKISYPLQYRTILVVLCLLLVGAGVWIYMEVKERPVFHAGDLTTLGTSTYRPPVAFDRATGPRYASAERAGYPPGGCCWAGFFSIL